MKANKTHFYCRIKGVPDDTFQVIGFEGLEHALSESYQFTVRLRAESLIRPKDVCGRHLIFEMAGSRNPILVHGNVESFSYDGPSPDSAQASLLKVATVQRRHLFTAHFVSPLKALKLNAGNRVFLNKSVFDIIKEVLAASPMLGAGFEIRAKASYPAREFTLQYDESDYDFIRRLMADHGLFFRLEQQKEQALLTIHDQVADLPYLAEGGELLFKAHSGGTRDRETIFAFRPQATLATAKVTMQDFNYRTPEVSLEITQAAQATSPTGYGSACHYGDNFKSMDEGTLRAKARGESLDWQRQTFVAESDCRAAAPGYLLTMTGFDDKPAYNGDYLIIEVEHQGDQGAGLGASDQQSGMTYRNKMLLIKAGVPFRKPLGERRRVHTAFTARVESSGGAYAHLDNQGRYRLRLDLDLGQASQGEASHPVRLMQPYGGNDYGLHFPLHAGTEVAVACLGGDLDRPIILGALPNPESSSPVSASNPSDHVLRTWGGNELVMSDLQGKEHTTLATRAQKNRLILNADHQGHQISLVSDQGKMEIKAATTMLLEAGDSLLLETGADQGVEIENNQELLTKNKEIQLQAATDINLEAGDHILLKAEQQNSTLTTDQQLAVKAGNSLSAKISNANLTMLVDQGNIRIQAANAITISGKGSGLMHLGHEDSGLDVTSNGDLIFAGPSLTINAATINIKGSGMGSN